MRATLVTDGAADRVLLPLLRWLIGQHTREGVELRWADLRGLPAPPPGLREKVTRAVELHPCQLLFVHRDAEGQKPELRYEEILDANQTGRPHVAVVPVRMQEAWLLHDQGALREAAGRPTDTTPLDLPRTKKVELVPDPKAVLHHALRVASGARGRRAKRFSPHQAAHRLADLIVDWSPLRQLAAFRRLETDTLSALHTLGMAAGG